ncbi:MAG: YDG domain-containing protein, partial [Erysipelotrichaceae bacterium]
MTTNHETVNEKKKKRKIFIIWFILLSVGIGLATVAFWPSPKIASVNLHGTSYVGSELSVSITPTDAKVKYQWVISDSASGPFNNITGANSATYSIASGDSGRYIKVIITGIKGTKGSAESDVFGPIKTITVVWPTTSELTYGQSLDATILSGGSAEVDGIVVAGTFTFKDSSIHPTAGIYQAEVVFTPSDLSKYQAMSSTIDILVNKAVLIVHIDSKNVFYGSAKPKLTYSISGFVLGETSTIVSGLPSLATSYVAGSTVSLSPYDIIGDIGTLSSSNYNFTFISAEVTVKKSLLHIDGLVASDKIYDGLNSVTISGSAVLSGIYKTDDVSLLGTPVYAFKTTNAGEAVPVSTSGYLLTGTKADNYTLIQPILSADITPKTLTVSGLTGEDKTYDGTTDATSTGSASLVGIVGTDDVTLTGTPVFTFASADVANDVEITTTGYILGGTKAGNYTLVEPTLSANIESNELIITADDDSKTYGDSYSFSGTEFSVTGLNSGDSISSVSLSSTGAIWTATVGDYDIL